MKLLNVANAKTSKGEALGYLTGVLYLAPATEGGVGNMCPKASPGCVAACLHNAGRIEMEGALGNIRKARIARTKLLMQNRAEFLTILRKEIAGLVRKAAKQGLIPCIRLNGTSDLPFLPIMLCREFPNVQFYDYTKIPLDNARLKIGNYHLTFSRSELNDADCIKALETGNNVAVAFSTRRGQALPAEWNGYRVIDGDISDLRFLDPKGVVVGLRAKGQAHRKRTINSPFIVQTGKE